MDMDERFFLPGEQARELPVVVQVAQPPHESGDRNGRGRRDLGALRQPRVGAARRSPGQRECGAEHRVEQQHREGLRDDCGGLFRLRLLFALGVGRVHPHLPDLSHRVLHDGLPARARSRRVESGVEHHRNCPRVERGRQLRADVEAEV